jgi:hypothetical protein
MKLLSTKTHGVIDYVWAGLLPVLPSILNGNSTTSWLLRLAGLTSLAYSLLTRYELGAAKVLPMKTHLRLDFVQSVLLITSPLWTGEQRKVRWVLLGLGIFSLVAALVTEKSEPKRVWMRWPSKIQMFN